MDVLPRAEAREWNTKESANKEVIMPPKSKKKKKKGKVLKRKRVRRQVKIGKAEGNY